MFKYRLRILREQKQLKRRVLSELCGLASTAIKRYEEGECEPTLHSLIAIADFFGVSIDYLVGKSDRQ